MASHVSRIRSSVSSALLVAGSLIWTACSTADGKTKDRDADGARRLGVAGRRRPNSRSRASSASPAR